MKLNITPGPWVVDGWDLYDIDGKFFEDTSNDREAECTAVNNTYHKGINPEAVPEMKASLDIIIEYTFCLDSDAQKCLEHIRKLANQALQKATL